MPFQAGNPNLPLGWSSSGCNATRNFEFKYKLHFLCKIFSSEGNRSDVELKASFASKID